MKTEVSENDKYRGLNPSVFERDEKKLMTPLIIKYYWVGVAMESGQKVEIYILNV